MFKFYYAEFESKESLKEFIDNEFRNLLGRVYVSKSNDKRLIIAVNGTDKELKKYLHDTSNVRNMRRDKYYKSEKYNYIPFNELHLK